MVFAWRVCYRWMKRMGSIPSHFLCLTVSVFPSSPSILWKTEFDSAFLHALYSLFIMHPFSCWPPLNLMPMSSISTVSELHCLPFLAETCFPGWVPLPIKQYFSHFQLCPVDLITRCVHLFSLIQLHLWLCSSNLCMVLC